MISTLKQVAMAEKMSVPQLQQAVQNGTIKSWIGIPMIQDRMQEQEKAQMEQAAAQPQPPKVAEQVMAKAAQQGLEGLPTNLPQQYAHGGIIAMAEGGEVDDAYEQYLEDAEEAEFEKYAEAMAGKSLNKTPDAEQGLRAAPSMSYGQVQGVSPRNANIPTGGVVSLIGDAAARQGIPADLANRIAIAEGGGRMDAKDPRSSAKGGFGMIDSTWRAMGGTAENRFDPNVNAELGTKLIRQNAEAMKKALGRDPSYGEVYAAHHFGTGVSKMLKGASPDTPIERGLSMFESPKRVKLIMEQNPYLKGKTVGDVMNRIEDKMGEGIVSLAEGGAVKRYAAGDVIDVGGLSATETDDPNYVIVDGVKTKRSLLEQSAESPWNTVGKGTETPPYAGMMSGLYDSIGTGTRKALAATGDVVRYPVNKALKGVNAMTGWNLPATESDTPFYDEYVRGYTPPTEVKPETQKAAAASAEQAKKNLGGSSDEGIRLRNAAGTEHFAGAGAGAGEGSGAGAGAGAEKSYWDQLIEQLGSKEKKRAEQRDQDKWMGLLSAGLGMMAGNSPYAAANVGQGGLFGLQQYAAARKATAGEEAADLKNIITAQRYKSLDEHYKGLGASKIAAKEKELELRESNQNQKNLLGYENMWNSRLNQAVKAEMDPAKQAQIRQEYMDKMYADPTWQKLYKQANPGIDLPSFGGAGVSIPSGVKVTRVG